MYAGSLMQVPKPAPENVFRLIQRRSGLLLLLAAVAGTSVFAAPRARAKTKQTGPEIRLPLGDLGFPGISSAFLSTGGSMLTVHFADSDHLLVTFSLRGLVPRLEGDRAGDEDRMVAAELIELSSHKVVARTEWHLHDHGRYLWNLGNGRFLLRVQDTLSTFAPAANLGSKDPFLRTSFPRRPGSVEAVVVSSDSKLVTVETGLPQPKTDPEAARKAAFDATRPHFTSNAAAPPPPPPPPPPVKPRPTGPAVAYDFYRISGAGSLEDPLQVQGAGAFGADSVAALPLDGDGYLRSLDQSHGKWALSFHTFAGKDIPLAPITTTCAPTVQRVSSSQFVSLNCHGLMGGLILAAYDFENHEMWEEPLSSSGLPSTFSLAPSAGRFAVSRLSTMNSDAALSMQALDTSATQDVRVYQTQTGDQLLKIDCSPIFRSAENFDLSPDGMRVAVVRKSAVEVYRLPELTKQDIDDLAELQKIAPPPGIGRINLTGLAETAETAQASVATVNGDAPPPAANTSGDTQTRRPPPSLLNPGEKPEFPGKNPTN
jgi:hypothetical protein